MILVLSTVFQVKDEGGCEGVGVGVAVEVRLNGFG
jgi:hypothetical protein